jgi:transposase InsO family protein
VPGLLFHSDRGSQNTSERFRTLLTNNGITQSLSRRGQCWDNSVAESWFATYKAELVDPASGPPWPGSAPPHSTTSKSSTTAGAVTPPSATSVPPDTSSTGNTPPPRRHNQPVRQNGARPDGIDGRSIDVSHTDHVTTQNTGYNQNL